MIQNIEYRAVMRYLYNFAWVPAGTPFFFRDRWGASPPDPPFSRPPTLFGRVSVLFFLKNT